MTWQIFLGLTVVVGFIITIITPITKLTNTMTELTISVKGLKESLAEIVNKNHESHARMWEHNGKQDKILEDHEKRIGKIELQKEIEKEIKKENE